VISDLLTWMNANAAAIQALSTVVLVLITGWYALRTHQLTSASQEQLALLRRAHEHDVEVTLSSALVPFPDGRTVEAFSLKAGNRGHRAVTLNEPVIVLPDDRTLVLMGNGLAPDGPFPRRLESGEGCSMVVAVADIIGALIQNGLRGKVQVRVRFSDKVDNRFESRPITIDITKWASRLQGTR